MSDTMFFGIILLYSCVKGFWELALFSGFWMMLVWVLDMEDEG